MSRRVKKSRAHRPRAKWKIDAPCIIVLSTSKKAAAVRSGAARGPRGHRIGRRAVRDRRGPTHRRMPVSSIGTRSSRSGPTDVPAHLGPPGRPRVAGAPQDGSAQPDPAVRITLIGKPGCHLCDDAREVVARVAQETGAGWHELSILDDPDLAERYWEQIPVVLVDGVQHDFWRVDERAAAGALSAAGWPAPRCR